MLVPAILITALMAGGCGLADPFQPDWVVQRRPLPACGAGAGPADVAAQECLFEAYRTGRDAELVSSSLDPIGRPIVSYLRVHENGTIEMFLDLPGDALSSWERFRCERLVPAAEGGGPALPADTVFVQEGCEMLPLP